MFAQWSTVAALVAYRASAGLCQFQAIQIVFAFVFFEYNNVLPNWTWPSANVRGISLVISSISPAEYFVVRVAIQSKSSNYQSLCTQCTTYKVCIFFLVCFPIQCEILFVAVAPIARRLSTLNANKRPLNRSSTFNKQTLSVFMFTSVGPASQTLTFRM